MSLAPDGRPVSRDECFLAAQAGHAWALRGLYDDLAPRIAAYLRARGAADPEDLTSEVFLGVLPRLATVNGGVAGLRSLLFSVAHARLVDSFRERARRPDPVPYDAATDPRTAPSAEDDAQHLLGTERAVAMLARLPAAQREVLSLRILGDLTVEQVATVLATTEGAVKQHQRRGLLALRALVTEGAVTL